MSRLLWLRESVELTISPIDHPATAAGQPIAAVVSVAVWTCPVAANTPREIQPLAQNTAANVPLQRVAGEAAGSQPQHQGWPVRPGARGRQSSGGANHDVEQAIVAMWAVSWCNDVVNTSTVTPTRPCRTRPPKMLSSQTPAGAPAAPAATSRLAVPMSTTRR